ncbi:protein PFC0760c-like [Teleopsis dalmanni]|uniref:protein PFC0760c-like n=1 Tax=Teleopsis dalmanni TaxID=139649 RepID=UPI0018CD9CC2|nr:protein PFC0760c-like [Teleopsis dalmanni]XP_037950906.1 protein PFC0760c-like [Teleopsis dalmanni]
MCKFTDHIDIVSPIFEDDDSEEEEEETLELNRKNALHYWFWKLFQRFIKVIYDEDKDETPYDQEGSYDVVIDEEADQIYHVSLSPEDSQYEDRLIEGTYEEDDEEDYDESDEEDYDESDEEDYDESDEEYNEEDYDENETEDDEKDNEYLNTPCEQEGGNQGDGYNVAIGGETDRIYNFALSADDCQDEELNKKIIIWFEILFRRDIEEMINSCLGVNYDISMFVPYEQGDDHDELMNSLNLVIDEILYTNNQLSNIYLSSDDTENEDFSKKVAIWLWHLFRRDIEQYVRENGYHHATQ